MPQYRSVLNRREFAALLGAGAITFNVSSAFAQPQEPVSLNPEEQPFSINVVADLARQLSKKAFVAPSRTLPDVFANLNYEQYASISSNKSAFIWANENWGFAIEPLHRGFLFNNAVKLYTVENGIVNPVRYDPKQFNFGALNVPNNLPDLDFSGFRLHTAQGGNIAEFAIIQGATFFQAIARGQSYGTTARALTLKPADIRGEEFPVFKAFWIERPAAGSNALVVNGLLDSESVAGSIRLTFRPGEMTIVDVELTLFPRVTIEHVGIAGMSSRFLFAPHEPRRFDDYRPAVHEANGLQMHNGRNEWLWRPLKNPDSLQISQFMDSNPKGFGLVQRTRDFELYGDDDRHFERSPSLWVEPLADWNEGVVQLIEIPSDAEINANILSYWRPKEPIKAGSEASFAYRQYWAWTPPNKPTLASVTTIRVGKGASNKQRRFLVEFTGDNLTGPVLEQIQPDISAKPGTANLQKIWKYPDRKTVRVVFDLDPGSENASEIRLVLMADGTPASEIWLYRWTA